MEHNCRVCNIDFQSHSNSKYCTICKEVINKLVSQFMNSFSPIARELIIDFVRKEKDRNTPSDS